MAVPPSTGEALWEISISLEISEKDEWKAQAYDNRRIGDMLLRLIHSENLQYKELTAAWSLLEVALHRINRRALIIPALSIDIDC